VSDWFVESLLPTFPLIAPAILTDDGSFGVVSYRFGFTVRGVDGQIVVVEGSSNLVRWTSLFTNAASSNGRFYFSDSDSTARPARFYRARLWP